jgi:hypothetical protein
MYIEDYERTPFGIKLLIEEPTTELTIDNEDFEEYLKDCGTFYYESNEVIDGQHVSKSHKSDLYDYFQNNSYVHILSDLTDYLKDKNYFI